MLKINSYSSTWPNPCRSRWQVNLQLTPLSRSRIAGSTGKLVFQASDPVTKSFPRKMVPIMFLPAAHCPTVKQWKCKISYSSWMVSLVGDPGNIELRREGDLSAGTDAVGMLTLLEPCHSLTTWSLYGSFPQWKSIGSETPSPLWHQLAWSGEEAVPPVHPGPSSQSQVK